MYQNPTPNIFLFSDIIHKQRHIIVIFVRIRVKIGNQKLYFIRRIDVK
jgi:hypothetical protein